MERPQIRVNAAVIGCPDPRELASFYEQLLGWIRITDEPGWVQIRPPVIGMGLSFQTEESFIAPVWPSEHGAQQMMMHLDIATDDLDAAVGLALELGAHLSEHQPREHVRVLLDPVGHPFCLFHGTF
jgi:catechol 2,3-dioxygenase-like lactoylglutathione lyase family enzyme